MVVVTVDVVCVSSCRVTGMHVEHFILVVSGAAAAATCFVSCIRRIVTKVWFHAFILVVVHAQVEPCS